MSFRFNQGDRPLPGYTIQRGVGRGGFGEVYYATSDGGKEVALKYLRENPAIEVRGAQHCLNLKSPYLVDLHDIRQNAEGEFFVIMEFVHGSSLRDLMNSEPHGLGAQKAAYLVREIGKGLAYLHDRGIVHRDLKPGNIFYEDGYVKIGDYGLSKVMAASQHSGQTISVGTVHYMAPEVGSGNYDKTIDIYALGVILYEMVLGKVPFAGSSMGEVLMKHLTAQPAVDELPEPFPTVIRKALAKEPRDRYQTVQEMMTDLFAVEDLDRSVAAFEPHSLTVAAARVARDLAAKKTPVIGGAGSSNVATATPPPIVHPDLLADRRGFGGGGLGGDRIDGPAARISPGSGVMPATPNFPAIEQPDSPSASGQPVIARLLATFGMVTGISIAAGVLFSDGRPAVGGAVFLNTCAVIQGVLLGSWMAFEKLRLSDKWLPRILITCVTAPALLPGGLVLASDGAISSRAPVSLGGILLLGLMLMDWPRRVALARKGELSLKSALLAGLFGWICAAVVMEGRIGLAMPVAATLAAASLAVQALSRLRGHVPGIRTAMASGGAHVDPWDAALTPMAEGEAFGNRSPAAVAVELPTAAPQTGPQVQSPSPAWRASTVPPIGGDNGVNRVERSGAVRALWFVASLPFFATGVILYILVGLEEISGRDDEAAALIIATSCMLFGLACATRSLSRWSRGWWRGIARPGITALGISATAGAGIYMGVGNPRGEEMIVSVIFLVTGAVLFLASWIVPPRLFDPAAAPTSPAESSDELARTHARGRLLVRFGLGAVGLGLLVLLIILTTVREHDWDDAIPGTMIPIGTIAIILLIVGFRKMKKTAESIVIPVTLPIRRDFDVAANANLSKLIERHMVMLGYTMANRSDLLWQFTRGNFAAQFWSSDVRQWGTRVNIAAYELDNGSYRVSCLLDIERMFNSPSKDMKAVLDAELKDLCDLLAGQQVVVGSWKGGPVR